MRHAWDARLSRLEAQRPERAWLYGHGLADVLRYAVQVQHTPWDLPDLGDEAEEATGLMRLLREARRQRLEGLV